MAFIKATNAAIGWALTPISSSRTSQCRKFTIFWE
jgi:hypothetical protein